MKLPSGFRSKITVFGERFVVIDVREDVTLDAVLVLYQNRSAPTKDEKHKSHVTTLTDWMEWDRNAQAAKPRNPWGGK